MLVRNACKNLKSYDNPFWGKSNAGKNKKSGIMGVLRSSWFEDMLEVLMRKSEIQNFRFSSPPVAEIMENKGFAHN